jgi:hypothetical protein
MDFVKKHLLMLISAAVAVLALVILFLGISRLEGTKEVLNKAQDLAKRVEDILAGVPVQTADGRTIKLIPTEKTIEEMKKLEIVYKEQGYSALQKALHENVGYDPAKKTLRRQLLLDGVFPKPVSDDRPFKFPQKYKEAIDGLLPGIQAGGVPTAKDIAEEREILAQEEGLMTPGTSANEKPKPTPASVRRGFEAQPAESAGQAGSELDNKAVALAAGKKADKIKVYCDSIAALDVIQNLYARTEGTPPGVELMWWAQLSYWIQSDILNAIAQANASAKNVRESVVKRILSVQVAHGYQLVTEDGRTTFVGANDIQSPSLNFTNLASDKFYDIVRFQVNLIIDARKIPQWIDAMYKQSHCLLYMWNIQAMDSSDVRGESGSGSMPVGGGMGGPNFGGTTVPQAGSVYQYGSSPVVRLKTWWEAYLLRDFYHWGIVGYGIDKATEKSFVSLYNGKKQELESIDLRTGLDGLMPKTIRQALGSETPDAAEGAETSGPRPPRAPKPTRNSNGNEGE